MTYEINKKSTDYCVVPTSRIIWLFVLLVYCEVWIWIIHNLFCPSCKRINFVLLVKRTLMSLFRFFVLCFCVWLFGIYETSHAIQAGICLLKISIRNTRTRCERCSKLTIKTLEQCQCFLVSLLITLYIFYTLFHC